MSGKEQKSIVMRKAWQIAKDMGYTFSQSLKQAWAYLKKLVGGAKVTHSNLTAQTLSELLRANKGTLTFTKKDGSISIHEATKIMEHIPTDLQPKGNSSSDKVITFFSLTANEWRCLSLASLPTAQFTV